MFDNLTEEEYTVLQEHKLVERIGPNKRKISSSYLSPPTFSAGSILGSSSSVRRLASASWASRPVVSPDLIYPVSPVSVEALEFIGLKRYVAQCIFENLELAQIEEELEKDDLEEEVPSFIRGHLSQLHKLGDLPTVDAFATVGPAAETIATILDPEFQEIFETNMLFDWAYETLRMRFYHVLLVEERIKKSAEKAVLAKKHEKPLKLEDLFGSNKTRSSESSGSQTHALSGTTHSGMNSHSSHLPTTCTFVESAPTPPEDHPVLYTGKCPTEFKNRPGTAFIQEDGSIDMAAIWSHPDGDFNANARAWYFTTEHETADIYRRYAARRCKKEETWIIRVAIPRQLAATLHTEHLWWSPDFCEYVWHCRTTAFLPEKLQPWASSDILEGHILRDPRIRNCDKSKIYVNITEDKLCRLRSGRKATHWVVMNDASASTIAEWSRGNVHIEVFAAEVQQGG